MSNAGIIAPQAIREISLPRSATVYPSPSDDWQSEAIYFLLPDRFSDGKEDRRPLLDRNQKVAARGPSSSWQRWSLSGRSRWQGGTLLGVRSKLSYLKHLGVTALWIGPVFRQRRELNTFHGYSIQNFLDVDPRLGTSQDLVDLVSACHDLDVRVILDIVFNHSGNNWVYQDDENLPSYQPFPQQLAFGKWRDSLGQPRLAAPAGQDDGVWPIELQDANAYMRAGLGNLDSFGSADPNDGTLEFRRSDFPPDGLRKFNHFAGLTLSDLALCYKYWIGLTDCDGFRIDTMKHVTVGVARDFAGAIKEFAASIGKSDFFLVGEIAGGDTVEDEYLDCIDQHKLNAALEIAEGKRILRDVARGVDKASAYLQRLPTVAGIGETRKLGSRFVSVLDDHDNLSCEKLRFAFSSPTPQQVVAALAIQFFSLSIPCIYYGTEQALSYNGPPEDPGYEVAYLIAEGWGTGDWFLREAMFGPEHPLLDAAQGTGSDSLFPGFGPFGTSGFHCFDELHPAFVRIAHLLKVRKQYPALRLGRQYQRPLGQFGWGSVEYPAGEIVAWSRILDDREFVALVNSNGTLSRFADVLVDFNLNGPGSVMTVVANTAENASLISGVVYRGTHPVGSTIAVNRATAGPAFVSVIDLGPSEVLVLGQL